MTSVRKTYVDGPFGQVHCRSSGESADGHATIACLHMSPKSGKSYHDVLPFLAKDRLAIAPDYPGHGESDLPPADPHVTIADFANSCWAAIDAIAGDGPVFFVGYHTGAMVAVEATVQQPDRVRGIVSISAPIFTDDELAPLNDAYSPIPIDEDGSRFRIMWERVLQHRGPGMTLQMAAASFAENLRAGDDYEWGHRAAFAYAPDYNRRLGELEHPILVMNPADDCFEQSRRADAIMRNGTRRDFPDWGHGFLNAFPAEAADVILEFVDGVESND